MCTFSQHRISHCSPRPCSCFFFLLCCSSHVLGKQLVSLAVLRTTQSLKPPHRQQQHSTTITTMYQATSVESRRADCARLLAKYPGAVPVVAQASDAKSKPAFVALPHAATVADLERAVRDAACLRRSTVTLLVQGGAPAASTPLGDLYQSCKADDGFLYVSYAPEKRLGNTVAGGLCNIAVGSKPPQGSTGGF